jgi:N-dimethylarginine dimethylaminohydrolase
MTVDQMAHPETTSAPITTAAQIRQAELIALQQIVNTLNTMTSDMATHREKMNTMVIDIALIKERQTNQAGQSLVIEELRSRIEILESRRHQQDGAASFARWLKDFGPWVIAGAAALWTYVKSLTP